jgi:hypothetical protein
MVGGALTHARRGRFEALALLLSSLAASVYAADGAALKNREQAVTHCTADEVTYFSCPVRGRGKVVSVCGGPGWMQYRFGPLGRLELVFPSAKSGSLQQFRGEYHYHRELGQEASVLSFNTNGVDYAVTQVEGDSRFVGVVVSPGKRKTTRLPCRNDQATGNLEQALDLLPAEQ